MNSIGKKYVDGFSSALKNASRPIPTEDAMTTKKFSSQVEWKSGAEVINVKVGDMIVTAAGAEIEVTGVEIEGLHLRQSTVFIEYTYNDNGRKGTEKVTSANFYNNINS
jgi:hypothetical protein